MCQDNIPHTTSSLTCVYRQAESTLPNSDRWNSSEQLIWGEVSSVGDESFDLWAPERTTYLNSRGRYDLAACPCICACVWGGVDDALKKNAVSGLALQFLRVRVPRSPWSSLCRRLRGLCLRLSSAEASVSTTKLLCVLSLPQLCKSAELCMLSHPPGGNLQNKVKVEKTTQRGQNTEAWKDYRGWDKTGAVSLQYRRSLLPPLTLRFI